MAEIPGEFHNLDIWRRGFNLCMAVYRLTALFSEEGKQSLAGQLKESANSVIAKIAEAQGHSKNTEKQDLLTISCGKIEETLSHLSVARGLKQIKEDNWRILDREYRLLREEIKSQIRELTKGKSVKSASVSPKKKNLALEILNERQQKILDYLKENEKINLAQVIEMFPKIGSRSLRRDISILCQRKLVAKLGNGRNVFYAAK